VTTIPSKAQALEKVEGRRNQLLAALRARTCEEIGEWDGSSNIRFYPAHVEGWSWGDRDVLDVLIKEIEADGNGWTAVYSTDGSLTIT
jgi:hypothetical protein